MMLNSVKPFHIGSAGNHVVRKGKMDRHNHKNINGARILVDIFSMREKASDERERQIIRSFREVFLAGKKSENGALLKKEKAFTSSADLEHWINLAEKIGRLRKLSGFDSLNSHP